MGPISGPIVILAGSGQLPLLLADSLRRRGVEHRILAFRGFAAPPTRRRADAVIHLLDVKRILRCLEGWRPGAVILAGAVRRPNPAVFLSAFSAFRNRRELSALLEKGDDQLLRSAVGLLEQEGHRVVGIIDLAPELLAGSGCLTRAQPAEEDLRAITIGTTVLADLSPYDMGQAAVVAGERIVALEGPEGTDRMLARVRGFRRLWSRARVHAGGVLVKTAKRGQDLRVDLPAIGPRTMKEAHAAGLRGVAVGSGVTLILDQPQTLALADRLGLFLVGVAGPTGLVERTA